MLVVFARLALGTAMVMLASTSLRTVNFDAPSVSEAGQQPGVAKARGQSDQSAGSLELPIRFDRHLGDLDGMVKRHQIRVLVVPGRSSFFYDLGQPHGIFYEAFDAFQNFVNEKLKTGTLKINIMYIPVGPDLLQDSLQKGIGDIVGYPVIVTPERQKEVLFTNPIYSGVKQVVVTGPKAPPINSLEDLSGKEIYINPLTAYFESLKQLNESFAKANQPPIIVKSVDPNLTDEDLLEMVSAGLLPATVTINIRADFWSKVLPHLTLHPNIVLKDEGELAWATRNDSPELRNLLNEFTKSHHAGTSFGNTEVRRYLENTKWVKDASSAEGMKKFQAYVRYFKKYAAEYDFDYLMLVAQGYQESLLDQNRRSPSGAIGIMQVIPKYAEAPPIGIKNVDLAENNIHAGAKMMHSISETYFNDPKLDALNRTLLSFAAYNAGPSRIARLRKKAVVEGLDPNRWFGNVELVVAKEVGQETTQYVSNIFKYYVAYKMTLEQIQEPN